MQRISFFSKMTLVDVARACAKLLVILRSYKEVARFGVTTWMCGMTCFSCK
jgi:hypothetical protein